MTVELQVTWTTVCPFDRLQPERGVAALLGDVQVAIVRTRDDTVHAIGNVDPFSGAAVLSRGIVGDRGGRATVQSPIKKQAFALDDGVCLDDPKRGLPVYETRITSDGFVEIRAQTA